MTLSLFRDNTVLARYASMKYWQVAFWLFLCVVTFFTLTLWYSYVSIVYIAPVLVQSLLGLVLSIMLQKGIHYFWDTELWLKALINILLVAAVSLAWTVARMYVFEWSTGETHIWQEFGGWYFSSIFVFISWTAVYYGIQYYRLLQEKQRDMRNAEAATREAELKRVQAQAAARDAQLQMLRYQLNPHFLCNTLNAINALIEVGQHEKAQAMTVNLSCFLRYSLDNIPEGKISLKKELDTLRLYLEIENTRFEDRLHVIFDILTDDSKVAVPSLILQPIIENSMKHAVARSEKGGTIVIRAQTRGERLCLVVEDSGGDKKPEDEGVLGAFDKGVGLTNTKQRLGIMYQDRYEITLSPSSLGGLKTEITFPLEPFIETERTSRRIPT